MQHLQQQAMKAEIASLRTQNRLLLSSLESEKSSLAPPLVEDDRRVSHKQIVAATSSRTAPTPAEFVVSSIRRLSGHSKEITGLQFSSTADILASSSMDGTVRVWHEDGRSTPMFGTSEALCVEWACRSNDVLLVGSADSKIKVWNVQNKRILCEIDTKVQEKRSEVSLLRSCPSGSLLVAVNNDKVEKGSSLTCWSLKTGRYLKHFPIEPESCPLTSLSFNHNGNILATAGTDGFIRIIDMGSSRSIMAWSAHDKPITSLHFGADETTIISASADRIVEWNLHRVSQVVREMPIELGSSASAQVAPDLAGTHLLATSPYSAAVIIDWRKLTALQTLPAHAKGHVHKVDWQQGSNTCASVSSDNSIIICELTTPSET